MQRALATLAFAVALGSATAAEADERAEYESALRDRIDERRTNGTWELAGAGLGIAAGSAIVVATFAPACEGDCSTRGLGYVLGAIPLSIGIALGWVGLKDKDTASAMEAALDAGDLASARIKDTSVPMRWRGWSRIVSGALGVGFGGLLVTDGLTRDGVGDGARSIEAGAGIVCALLGGVVGAIGILDVARANRLESAEE